MNIKLTKENEKALQSIINEYPGDDELTTIDELANWYIEVYIRSFFTNGDDYFKGVKK